QQGHLLDALFCQVGDLDQHVVKRPRNFFAARVGNHAKAAIFAAAFHDRHKCTGSVDACRRQGVKLFDLWKTDVDLRAAGLLALRNERGQAVQGLGAEHHVNVWRTLNNGFAFLTCHAASDPDDEVGIALLQVLHPSEIRKDLKQSKDRKSTRLNSSHVKISYAVFCLKKKIKNNQMHDTY